jgi:hypothetical protein
MAYKTRAKAEPFAGGVGWLAGYLGGEDEPVPLSTIYSWRQTNQGPPAYRIGKHLRYRQSEVDAWLAEQRDRRVGSRR